MEKGIFQLDSNLITNSESDQLTTASANIEIDGLTALHQTPFYLAELDFADHPGKKNNSLNRAQHDTSKPSSQQSPNTKEYLQLEKPSSKILPKDYLRSTSLETLLSQNEDLMARLKVTVRRLTLLENQNEELKQSYEEVSRSYQALSDQLLIWKEKENQWKGRTQSLEAELTTFKTRFPEYQQMEEKLHRFERYQEKVKTQIKPYIQQLKEYAESLHEQIRDLNSEILDRDTKIQDLQRQNQFLTENFEVFKLNFENQQSRIIEEFEKERIHLLNEIKLLQEQNTLLSDRADRLDKSLERQDELENLVIALRRSKEEISIKYEIETCEIRSQLSQSKNQNIENTLKVEDLKNHIEQLERQLAEAQLRTTSNDEQLASIRYLWKQKSEEVEHLKLSLQSLEKINLDLSQSLRDLRTNPAQC